MAGSSFGHLKRLEPGLYTGGNATVSRFQEIYECSSAHKLPMKAGMCTGNDWHVHTGWRVFIAGRQVSEQRSLASAKDWLKRESNQM